MNSDLQPVPARGAFGRPPLVSFVIPTLNAERILPACLASIRMQAYDPASLEILVADGGSTDRTRAIAIEHGARILNATGMMAEAAKRMAFGQATGRYLALLDADNEIADRTWLSLAVDALERHPDALGFESYYLAHPGHTALNRYLTACLQISDPYARFMAGRLRRIGRDDQGAQIWELPEDGTYPTGANGFIFRRELVAQLPADTGYHEATFFPALMRSGIRKLVKIRDCGIYHHYVTTWGDYYRKRQRAMIIYLLRQDEVRESAAGGKPAAGVNWDRGGGTWRKWAALAWFSTFLGPAVEGAIRAGRSGQDEWRLHPLAGWVSTAGNVVGMLKYRRAGGRGDRQTMTVALHNRKSSS